MKTNTASRSALPRVAGAALLGVALAATASAQTLVENFNGSAIDTATWYPRQTTGAITVSDGLAHLGVTATGSSQRALIVSQAYFDPFEAPVTVTFDNLTLSGTSATAQPAWGNAFYAALGRANNDLGTLDNAIAANYSNVGDTYATALGLLVRRSDTAVTLAIIDRASGTGNHTTTPFTLSAVPTDIVWSIEGDADGVGGTWSVALTGATFVVGETTVATMSGTFLKFNEAELLNAGSAISRLALGTINVGNLVTGSGITLDGVSVGAIPEPASFALLASALVGAATMGRRRRLRSLA